MESFDALAAGYGSSSEDDAQRPSASEGHRCQWCNGYVAHLKGLFAPELTGTQESLPGPRITLPSGNDRLFYIPDLRAAGHSWCHLPGDTQLQVIATDGSALRPFLIMPSLPGRQPMTPAQKRLDEVNG